MSSDIENNSSTIPVALTIAGSDSGGGAGIQADLRTFAALKVFGTSVITLITAQNTLGVTSVEPLSPGLVSAQIDSVMTDMGARAAKTGALGTRDIVEAVAEKVAQYGIENLVIDPVMISKHGHALIAPDAAETLIKRLFPLALFITPNAYEAAAILGKRIENLGDPRDAAIELGKTGAKNVLLKGGHLEIGESATDFFFDGDSVFELTAPKIDTPHTHGTGCTLSAAITAYLARGYETLAAVELAKRYISGALQRAVNVGKGISPVHHMFEYYSFNEQETGDDS